MIEDLERKIVLLEVEIDDLAKKAASSQNSRPYELLAFGLINSLVVPHGYGGGKSRQYLIRYFYQSLNNYRKAED